MSPEFLFQHPTWLQGGIGLVLIAAYALHQFAVHLRYVLTTRVLDKTPSLILLFEDLLGYWLIGGVLSRLYPDSTWILWTLVLHFAVHAGSAFWGIFHFKSLHQHMTDFQQRRLPVAFTAVEWAYEQNDTALYLLTAVAIVCGTAGIVPPPLLVLGAHYALVLTATLLTIGFTAASANARMARVTAG